MEINNFVEKVSRRRVQKRLPEATLARMVGLAPSSFNRWTVHGSGLPTYRQAFELSRILDLPLEYLCDDDVKPSDEPKGRLSDAEKAILTMAETMGHEEALRRLTLACERPATTVRQIPPPQQPPKRNRKGS